MKLHVGLPPHFGPLWPAVVTGLSAKLPSRGASSQGHQQQECNRVSRADLRPPGPKLHPGSAHTPLPRRQPLLPHLAQPFQGQCRCWQSLWGPHSWGWAGTQVVLAGRDVTFRHFLISSWAQSMTFQSFPPSPCIIYKRAHWHTHFALDPGDFQGCWSSLVLIS